MKDLKPIRPNLYAVQYFFFLCIFFITSGCVHLVSYYDAISYKNLTDLKGEIKVFFDRAVEDGAHGEADLNILKDFKVKMSRAYEYEKGKTLNEDTIAQFAILDSTLNDVLERYKKRTWNSENNCEDSPATSPEKGCLTATYCESKWKVLETAFDIAITTERSKLEKKN
ncbi:MAG: hypothetical protein ACE5HS_08645 [bacterium]